MKKILTSILCLLLIAGSIIPVFGEETTGDGNDFATNGSYYNEMCSQTSSALSNEEQATCKAYLQYLGQNSSSYTSAIAEINKKLPDIQKNIATYVEQIKNYDGEIAELNAQIAQINTDIAVKEEEIRTKEVEIQDNEAKVEELKAKVLSRMANSQSSMRLNQYLDIVMGSKDLNDLLRRTNAIKDITNYDQTVRDELAIMIDRLNIAKASLEEDKAELDKNKAEVVDLQTSVMVKRQEAEIVKVEFEKQSAELQAEAAQYTANLAAIQEITANLSTQLGEIVVSAGWTHPVAGARITGHTWYYDEGDSSSGLHLGMDFANGVGTPLLAVGNGYILNSADGCGDGYLGSYCAGSGGVVMGGNQVYLLTNINGSLYAVSYNHLLAGSPIEKGTIVVAGQAVGQMGRSGNASGVHLHIEIFYLGSESVQQYASHWNGDMSFGTGWGYTGLSNSCENKGNAAPCRLRPESVFGG